MSLEYKQNTLKFWRKSYLRELKAIEDDLEQKWQQVELDWEARIKGATRPTHQKNKDTRVKFGKARLIRVQYEKEAFDSVGETLDPRGRDATKSVQFDPPLKFYETGITKWKCASGQCDLCGQYKWPTAELKATKKLKWYDFQYVSECSFCGKLKVGNKF